MAKPLDDYYASLDVATTATPEEIKVAYRRLAVQFHPDRGGDHDRFQQVGEAYSVLSDPEKRAAYDEQRTNRPVENLTESAASVVDEYFRTLSPV